MISELKIPTIHWNGTSKQALQGEYAQAYAALEEAKRKLAAVTVHGRDYYVQKDPDAVGAALRQAEYRLSMLNRITEEVGEILRGVMEQEARGA